MANVIKQIKSVRPMSRPEASSMIRKSCYLHGGKLVSPTKDHVIARQVFSPNRIENPLVLKACHKCNQTKQRDEEYCCLYIQAGASSGTGKAKESFDKTLADAKKTISPIIIPKEYQKPGAGLVLKMRNSLKNVVLQSSSGIYIDGGAFPIDIARIEMFFTNIAKGLIVNTTETIHDWKDFEFKVHFEQLEYPNNPESFEKISHFIAQNCQYAEMWEDALSFAGLNEYDSNNKLISLLSIGFFQHIAANVWARDISQK